MKTCTKCGGPPKPLTEFSKHARTRDGLQSQCKACNSIAAAAWYAANREAHKAIHDAWCAANPEKNKARMAKWAAENRDKVNTNRANWDARNPESTRIKNHNRRARQRDNGGRLSIGLVERLFKLQRGKCACGCKQPLGDNYHRDHIMPIALGGSNTDDNIQLLRQRCNNQKHAKHPVDFMQQRGFLL